jgi:catechol 2,3-dioxygenase-like lactoylglutathione lyase family enzyme
VPDIKSTRMDDSRAFYVDFLGLKVGMDMGFVMTFMSPSNPTAQISVVRDHGGSMLQPNVSVEVADVDEVHARAIRHALKSSTRSLTSPGAFADSLWRIRMERF